MAPAYDRPFDGNADGDRFFDLVDACVHQTEDVDSNGTQTAAATGPPTTKRAEASRLNGIGSGGAKPVDRPNPSATREKERCVEHFVDEWDADRAPER